MATNRKIKIGFIGLSSSQCWAVWAHLPYLKSSNKYEIVALCNSSVESAKAAIKAHGLPSTIRAYSSPEEIAADEEVELIVCCIRAEMHYDTLLPSIQAGKNIFCEWPLASNAEQAQELHAAAQEKRIRTLIGLQAYQSPATKKLKSVIDEGRIGRVLSSTFNGAINIFGSTETERTVYLSDIKTSENLVSIYGLHILTSIQSVLGPLSSYTPLLHTSYPTVQLLDSAGTAIKTVPRTTPDQYLLQGSFAETKAPFSFHLRGGPVFKRTEGVLWRIYGEKGEIQVTGQDPFLHLSEDNYKIEVFGHQSGETEVLEVEKDEWSGEVSNARNVARNIARNVARLYEGFSEEKGEEEGVFGWEVAVEKHKFVDDVLGDYLKRGGT